MAQWIPKTAWKVSNLNKRYGTPYVAGGHSSTQTADHALAAYYSLHTDKVLQSDLSKKILAALQPDPATGNRYPGAVVIDLRDRAERRHQPLPPAAALALHPHDILSGAAVPLLPSKGEAELFLVAANRQRAVNTSAALRRWGYSRITVVSYDVASEAMKGLETEKNLTDE
ncbi:hypothetical protein STCU_00074 [Strigomonas culicis]|uniref:Rhodanese domain-containing protein n=1 Tax=Strigomonas culicis TaxID=28005 RepID=S9V8V2_9TRYP|nr:hypothetical protein STCU_00866 [Strigomonas culicis]EPY37223.1 hypothetical protein STCU_00074 [Strigomonas culicis]|eukprot:EPY35878.1 hypothetical protein STCU_00866 [Strigomonas culicis]